MLYIAVVYWYNIILNEKPAQPQLRLECPHLMLGSQDRGGLLLFYHTPCCPKLFLLELVVLVLCVELQYHQCWFWGTPMFMLNLGKIN